MRSGARVIAHPDELDLDLREMPARAPFKNAVMVDPAAYDITYAINPHMEPHVGRVDSDTARRQWEELVRVIRSIGRPVEIMPATEGVPDLVFAANQSFPASSDARAPAVVLSRMARAERRPEVPLFEAWHRDAGRMALELDAPPQVRFEGTGDAAWVPGHRVIVAAHGFRTDPEALQALAQVCEAPVLGLELIDPHFYHLDTCLQLLDAQTALYVPEAFTATSESLLRIAFPRLVPVPLDEAVDKLACNGWCPDGRHYVVQVGASETRARVRQLGFEVVEIDTSEFVKSGGSVFCLKLEVP